MEMAASILSFAGKTVPLASPRIVDALFATISYRLEPQGRGSRFPFVMNRLYSGVLDPPELPAALAELGLIVGELRKLPANQAISSLARMVPFRPQPGDQVNPRAASVFDLLIGPGGEPLISTIQSAVGESTRAGVTITLGTPLAVRWNRKGLFNVALGLLWTGIGYVYFPHDIIVPRGMHSGPLAWPIGLVMLAGGLVSLLEVPAAGRSRRQLEWIGAALGVFAVFLIVWTWRS